MTSNTCLARVVLSTNFIVLILFSALSGALTAVMTAASDVCMDPTGFLAGQVTSCDTQ